MADATDKLLKTLREPRTSIKQPETPVGTTNAGEGFFLPNYSGIREKATIKNLTLLTCNIYDDGTNFYIVNSAGTTILTINLTTGNITIGGSQKYITCSRIVGA